MSKPIQENAKALVALLTDQKTVDTYKNFFLLTWKILKETANFLWLLILFVIVTIGWVVDNVTNFSDNFLAWRETVDQKPEGNVATEVGTKFWAATQKSAVAALASAREQLNIEAPAPKPPKAVPAPALETQPAQPATQPAPATATQPASVATTPAATPAPAAAAKTVAEYKQETTTPSSETSEG